MDRRALIGCIALGTLAAPAAARAQLVRKVARIGILGFSGATSDMIGPDPHGPGTNALLRGLRELGYVYGRDFVSEPRGADGRPDKVPGLVAELVRLQVDVIVAAGLTLNDVKRATSTIPVVMVGSDDPVGRGHVRSLAHPGGNITGLSIQGTDTVGKRLELLKEVAPSAATVAGLWDQASLPQWREAGAAAQQRRWKPLSLEIKDASEIDGAFRAATKARAGAILVLAGRFTFGHVQRVVELAAKSRVASGHRDGTKPT